MFSWIATRRACRVGTIGLLVLSPGAVPTSAGQDLRYLHHQAWSTEDGLPQDSVHQVVQGDDGFVWAATEQGLARFDGVAFVNFHPASQPAITSDDLCCIVKGRDGVLWIGTREGIVRLERGIFTHLGRAQGLPSEAIQALAVSGDGTLLALTEEGVVGWDAGRFMPMGEAGPLVGISPSRRGAWMLSGRRAALWENGKETRTIAWEGAGGLAGAAEAPDGALWMFSSREIRRRTEAGSQVWRLGDPAERGLPGTRVESLFVDRGGAAWVGTNDGVAVIHAEAVEATPVMAMRGSAVIATYQDREGNYWLATETSGLHILRELKFRSQMNLAGSALTAVVESSDGSAWVGTRRDGLRRVRDGVVTEPSAALRLTSPVILSLAAGLYGDVWVGTPDGLNHISANGSVQKISSADGLPDDYVSALAAEPDGSLWVGTRAGLAHLGAEAPRVLTQADGLGSNLIGSLLLTRNRELWIGTSVGISRLGRDGRMTNFGRNDGLGDSLVSAMIEDETGTLWIATRGDAVLRFANGAFRRVGVGHAWQIDGLALDGKGYLWLREERGISRGRIQDLNECADRSTDCRSKIEGFGAGDGIVNGDTVAVGSPSAWRMSNGEIWFATRRGAAIAKASDLPMNAIPPPVAIERLTVDDAVIDTTGQRVELPYGRGRLTIEYAALSFTSPGKVRYRFMLDGFDRNWTEADGRRSATYTNLPARAYEFRVQAMNNDGVWSAQGAVLRFRIVPPFYRRWWFAALVLLGLGGVAAGLYRMRLRRLQSEFDALLKERNRLAREIHDTLAQDFVGISIQLEILAQMLGARKVEDALEQVSQTRQLVTEGLAEARRSIWMLRAGMAQDTLPTRLRKVVERYSSPSLRIELKLQGAYRELDERVEDEVLRVAHESLSNVSRHAASPDACVGLTYEGDMLVLTVEDHGRGFDQEAAQSGDRHFGLKGMSERAAEVGGTLSIVSEPGAGTKVQLVTQIGSAEEKDG